LPIKALKKRSASRRHFVNDRMAPVLALRFPFHTIMVMTPFTAPVIFSWQHWFSIHCFVPRKLFERERNSHHWIRSSHLSLFLIDYIEKMWCWSFSSPVSVWSKSRT
jgi:hypothetical protein